MAQFHAVYTVGIGEDRDGMAIAPTAQAVIVNAIGTYLTGMEIAFTLTRGTGHWNGITEPVAVFTSDIWACMAELRMHAVHMANIAYQTSVHLSASEVYACNVTHEGKVDDGA